MTKWGKQDGNKQEMWMVSMDKEKNGRAKKPASVRVLENSLEKSNSSENWNN